MTFTKKAATFLATIVLSTTTSTVMVTNAQAATFTKDEIQEVHQIQNQYKNLPKDNFNADNLYASTPHLTAPFSPGSVTNSYINSQLDYINFYRALFDLPSISTNKTDNDNAQITASVMAAIKANPFTNQHGLPSETKPDYINKTYWTIAKNVSASSNLNFNVSNQSAGDVITDLLTDTYNLDGSDTGHRAWLLSSRLTTTGIGAAYGENNYRYSVQQVAYPSDGYKAAAKVQLLIQIAAFFQSNYFREIISPGPSIYRTKLFLVLPKLQLLILIPVKQVKQQKLITLVTKDTVISTLF